MLFDYCEPSVMSSIERSSVESERGREVPSFIEARPPLVTAPWLRPKPAQRTNLMDLYEDESIELEAESDLVQVYLRIKPCAGPSTLYDIRSDTVLATTLESAPSDYSRRTQCHMSKLHTFSHIFRDDATQAQIFEHVVKGNLKKLPDGHSYTLLTYGASGSGKTYTLMGTVEQPGLVPRSLEYLFRLLSPAQHPQYRPRDGGHEILSSAQQAQELELVSRLRRPTAPVRGTRHLYRRMSKRLSGDFHSTAGLACRHTHYVWVSFVEIYNEAVYDLLQRTDRSKVASKLRIYEDPNGTVYVKGATQAFVRTGTEAYDVMSTGRLNLRFAATGVHANSSRSHCIFTITLLTDTPDGVQSSCVRLCDLAGSERAERTQNAGVRMAESRAINSSLHVLERCLRMLRRKQRAANNANTTDAVGSLLVPFRESKLTRLLGAPLSGASREAVSMVVTVNPNPLYAQETRHVLQLAAVASTICVNTSTVEDVCLESTADCSTESSREMELLTLRADNERLRFEIERLYTQLEKANVLAASSREESASTMHDMVQEARESTRQYYTKKMSLQDGRYQIEKERLLKQIEDLVAENTTLKEQLSARPLEMAMVESELEHLHACLAERDRVDSGETNKEESPPESVVVVGSESESESSEESDSEYDPQLDAISEESMLGSKRTTEEWSRDDAERSRANDVIDEEDRSLAHLKGLLKNFEDFDNESDGDNEIKMRKRSSINCDTNYEVASLVDNQNITSIANETSDCAADTQKNIKKVSFHCDKSCDTHMFYIDGAKFSIDTENKVGSVVSISDINDSGHDEHTSSSETRNEEQLNSKTSINGSGYCNDECDKKLEYSVDSKAINEQQDRSSLSPITTEINNGTIPNRLSNDANPFVPNLETVHSKNVDLKNITVSSSSLQTIIQHEETDEINVSENGVEKVLTEQNTLSNNSGFLQQNELYSMLPNKTNKSSLCSISTLRIPEKISQNLPKTLEENIKFNGILSMCRPKSDLWLDKKTETHNLEKVNKSVLENFTNKCEQNVCYEQYKDKLCKKSILDDNYPPDYVKGSGEPALELKIDTIQLDTLKSFNKQETETIEKLDNNLDSQTTICDEKLITNEKLHTENFDIYLENQSVPTVSEDIENIIGSINFNTKQDKISNASDPSQQNVSEAQVVKRKVVHNLRLKKKNVTDDEKKDPPVGDNKKKTRKCNTKKLMDIANLQQEFSDVTLGVPKSENEKEERDIPSPEEPLGEENVPPAPATSRSCPPKSERRRKLYTPCAEPLEESLASDDDGNARVRIPRPSFHRTTRARRKL